MIELGKQYKTRDGREVRIYAVDGGGEYPVHGAIKYDGGWFSRCWAAKGAMFLDYQHFSGDLIASDARIACVKLVIDCEEGEGL